MAATYTLISSQVLGSSSASVTFSSIPQTYTDLKLAISARTGNGAYLDNLFMTISSDTGSNYSNTRLEGSGTTASSSATTNSTPTASANLSYVNAAGATASVFSNTEIYIPNYTSSTNKQIYAYSVVENNSATSNEVYSTAELWRGTSAVTSLTFSCNNSFVVNSSFYLYGIRNA